MVKSLLAMQGLRVRFPADAKDIPFYTFILITMMCDLFLFFLYCLSFEHKTELFDGLYNMKRRWGDIKVLVVLW